MENTALVNQIDEFIENQDEPKKSELKTLHNFIYNSIPNCKLWFLDGTNSENKVVSNINIGYGLYKIKYKNGSLKEFYQVGISPNKSGISVYLFGINDKNYLPFQYKEKIGKATITEYCIKFKTLKNINYEVLKIAILDGIKMSSN